LSCADWIGLQRAASYKTNPRMNDIGRGPDCAHFTHRLANDRLWCGRDSRDDEAAREEMAAESHAVAVKQREEMYWTIGLAQ
jgi:hypothetical protein